MGSESNDGHPVIGTLARPYLFRRGVAIQHWHLAVHQYECEPALLPHAATASMPFAAVATWNLWRNPGAGVLDLTTNLQDIFVPSKMQHAHSHHAPLGELHSVAEKMRSGISA